MKFINTKNSILLYQIFAIIVFLVLSISLTIKTDIDIDECYTLNTISGGVSRTLTQSIHFEGQLPFYFLVANLFSQISDSLFFLRFLSTLFVLINFIFIYKIFLFYFTKIQSFFIASYFLLHPYSLYIGSLARSYALLSSTILVSFFLLIKIYQYKKKIPTNLMIGFILVNLAGLHTHYYYLFYFGSIGLYMIFRFKNEISKKLLIVSVLSGLTIVPYFLFYFFNQFSLHADHIPTNSDFFNSLFMFLNKLKFYFISTDRSLIVIPFVLFTVVLIGYSIYNETIKKLISSSLFIVLLPQLFLFLFTYLYYGDFLVNQKHSVALFLFINFAFLYLILKTFKNYGIWIISSFLLLNLFFTLRMLKLNKFSYLQQAVSYIENKRYSNESILIFPNEFAQTFGFYFEKQNEIIPIPTEINYKAYKDSSYILTENIDIEEYFNEDTL